MKIIRTLILMAPLTAFSSNILAYAATSVSSSSSSKPESLGLYDLSYALDTHYSSSSFKQSGVGLGLVTAYDLVIRGDEAAKAPTAYDQQALSLGQDASVATDSVNQAVGFLVNTEGGPYEAAMAYHQSGPESSALKGRLTYKSRNNSQVRVDLVAEKYVANISRPEADSTLSKSGDSLSFLVGAKYQVTPRAYVSGQYGAVGFADSSNLEGAELGTGRDYWALSLEAGYKLSDSSVIYVSHAQKKFNDVAESDEVSSGLLASQLNSIGVRLNW